MRISGDVNVESVSVNKPSVNAPKEEATMTQGREVAIKTPIVTADSVIALDNSEETRKRVQEAVEKMNDMLQINSSTAKFIYHEGLERYYVTVVDRSTEEVVKEIPPKKLLDAFYEMQKMLGMIVDEKI